jgi:Xaa-Pro aminopeptidase
MPPIDTYRKRRDRLLAEVGRGVVLIPTAPEQLRSRDSHYPYRFDSHFHYLTGFPEPEAVLALVAGEAPRSILFTRPNDPDREIWDGFRHGPDGAREAFGFDEAYPVSELDEMLPKLLADQPVVHVPLGADTAWDLRVVAWINKVREQGRAGVCAPTDIRDVRAVLDEMRLVKDEAEIDTMRRAGEIAAAAHVRAMRAARPGLREYEVEAELIHEFRRRGAQAPAYNPIVAGGANACVLHYVENDAELKDGELLLIDAGCELDGYASDITRTFPVNGRFSPEQRAIYELVLAAQAAAIAQVKPGSAWDAPHEAALRVLAQGFVELGLCGGSVDAVLESGDYKRFYMHRTGHWLGMDVHDVGEYKRDGQWRALAPGMVLTVEPGCYVRPAENVSERFWNIGVRIEDDVVVTETGCEVLSAGAPKAIADIEALMSGRD